MRALPTSRWRVSARTRGPSGCSIDAGDQIELAGSVGYTAPGIQDWQTFPLDADVPMSISVRTGEPIWTESRR